MKKSKLILLPIFAMSIGMLTGCEDQIKNISADFQSQIDGIRSDIDDLKQQVADIKAQITALQTEMNNKIAEAKTEYTQKIASAESEIEQLNTALNNLVKQHDADKKAIEDDYKAKLAELEAKLQNADQALAAQLQQEKEALQADYTSKINTLQSTYEAKVQEIEASIATINTNITNLQTQLAEQVASIQNDYNGKINDLTERVSILEEVQTHTVSFDTKGAGEIASQVIVHGEKARKPEDPVKAGSTFKGWSYHDEPWYFYSSAVTEDMQLVAVWELIDYRVTFKNDDGTVLEVIDNVHYGETVTYSGDTPIKPNPEEHYVYTFTGWDKDLLVTGDMEFVAQYNAEYTPFQEVYLDANGDTIFSRYVPEGETRSAIITFKDKQLKSENGEVLIEAEDCSYTGSTHILTGSEYHNNKVLISFDEGATLTLSFTAAPAIRTNLFMCLARDNGVGHSVNEYFDFYLNGEKIQLSDDIKFEKSSIWEEYEVIDFGKFDFVNGENTIYIVSISPVNFDYFTIAANTFSLEDYGLSEPTKPNTADTMYLFHFWEEISNVNDVITFAPHFEEATVGLEFVKNKVDVYHGSATEVFVPSYWEGYNITEIGQNAFADSTVVTVHLPNTITLISNSAFKLATKLTTINMPERLKTIESEAFNECVKLKEIEFNEGLEFIGDRSFELSGLKEVTFPSSVKTLGERCFSGISADFIYVPLTVRNIYWRCFASDSQHINTIYCEREFRPSGYDLYWAEYSNVIWGFKSELEQDGFKYAIYEIDDVKAAALLEYDHSLTEFEVPEKVNDIPVQRMLVSFKGNDKLERVILPNCIDKVSDHMFEGCTSLKYVDIPESVVTIEESAFFELYNLETVVLHEGLKIINRYAFQNCTSLANITLPNGLTNIYGRSFQNCTSLTRITIPETVKYIEGSAFESSGLTFIDIPDSITVINEAMFMNCLSLSSIVFPSTLKSISAYAFAATPALLKVYYRGTEEQWNALPPYDGTNNQLNGATKYFYSETEPATPGNFWRYVEGVPVIW